MWVDVTTWLGTVILILLALVVAGVVGLCVGKLIAMVE